MQMIELSKIGREASLSFSDTDDPTEVRPRPLTTPVFVNVDAIRCFYPRKDNRPGTRITFTDGGGFAVTETVETVRDKVQSGEL